MRCEIKLQLLFNSHECADYSQTSPAFVKKKVIIDQYESWVGLSSWLNISLLDIHAHSAY